MVKLKVYIASVEISTKFKKLLIPTGGFEGIDEGKMEGVLLGVPVGRTDGEEDAWQLGWR